MNRSIELDCAPGQPRPTDLIAGVVRDTPLQKHLKEPALQFFGHARWHFPDATRKEWNEAKKPVQRRIRKLYEEGKIRYGSW